MNLTDPGVAPSAHPKARVLFALISGALVLLFVFALNPNDLFTSKSSSFDPAVFQQISPGTPVEQLTPLIGEPIRVYRTHALMYGREMTFLVYSESRNPLLVRYWVARLIVDDKGVVAGVDLNHQP